MDRVSKLIRSREQQSRRTVSRSDTCTTPKRVPLLRQRGERNGDGDAEKGKTECNPRLNFISGGRLGLRARPLRKKYSGVSLERNFNNKRNIVLRVSRGGGRRGAADGGGGEKNEN